MTYRPGLSACLLCASLAINAAHAQASAPDNVQSQAQPGAEAAPQMQIANVVGGFTTLPVRVRSLVDMRYANMVRQQKDFSCGAAAVATILRQLYQRPVTEDMVIDGMLKQANRKDVMERGFSFLDMKNFAEQSGLRGRAYQVDGVSLRAIKIPVIAVQNTGGYSHFIVLKRVENGFAYIADPALGNRQIPVEDFISTWNGVVFALVGDGIVEQNALSASARSIALPQRAGIITHMLPLQQDYGLLGKGTF